MKLLLRGAQSNGQSSLTRHRFTGLLPLSRYNRVVRIASALLLVAALTACNRESPSKDAIRQGVLDYLSGRNLDLNMGSMNVEVTALTVNNGKADATVSFTPKGANPAQGMTMRYQLQQRGDRWVVVGRQDENVSPHGAQAAPGSANPHAGGAGGGQPAGGMPGGAAPGRPSVEDLPSGHRPAGSPSSGGRK